MESGIDIWIPKQLLLAGNFSALEVIYNHGTLTGIDVRVFSSRKAQHYLNYQSSPWKRAPIGSKVYEAAKKLFHKKSAAAIRRANEMKFLEQNMDINPAHVFAVGFIQGTLTEGRCRDLQIFDGGQAVKCGEHCEVIRRISDKEFLIDRNEVVAKRSSSGGGLLKIFFGAFTTSNCTVWPTYKLDPVARWNNTTKLIEEGIEDYILQMLRFAQTKWVNARAKKPIYEASMSSCVDLWTRAKKRFGFENAEIEKRIAAIGDRKEIKKLNEVLRISWELTKD